MLPKESGSNDQSHVGEGGVSQNPEHAAQFWSSVAKLTSLLESNERKGRSLGDTTRTWHKWERDALLRQYEHVVNARFAWRHFLLNPFWTFFFVLKKRMVVKDPTSVQKKQWELLDYYLGRAEFMFSLSTASRNFMRGKIADGSISRRRGMALMRSFGCCISKSGRISASPIGIVGLVIGKAVTSVLVIMFVLVVFGFATELQSSCARPCVAFGSIQLMILAIYFASLSHALSTGRNRDALMLLALQGSQDAPNRYSCGLSKTESERTHFGF